MSQAADADDADAAGRFHIGNYNRIENSYAGAKQRSGDFRLNRIRQRRGPNPMTTDAIGETALPANHDLLGVFTKMLVARQTLRATHATCRKPANADALSDF